MSKLTLNVQDIAVLSDAELATVAGGNGTLGCSGPCPPTCDGTSNCTDTTGCAPTSRKCQCPTPTNTKAQ